MLENIYPMTKDGLEKLEKELNELQYVKREEIMKRIKHARSFCDFQDESEYDAALKERLKIEERIATIEQMIQNAKIIEKKDGQIVQLGSTVSIQEIPNGDVETYVIVGIEESDPLSGKISYTSPLASQLIGAKIGDIVKVNTLEADMNIKVMNIS